MRNVTVCGSFSEVPDIYSSSTFNETLVSEETTSRDLPKTQVGPSLPSEGVGRGPRRTERLVPKLNNLSNPSFTPKRILAVEGI